MFTMCSQGKHLLLHTFSTRADAAGMMLVIKFSVLQGFQEKNALLLNKIINVPVCDQFKNARPKF